MTKFEENEVIEMKNKGKLRHIRNIWSRTTNKSVTETMEYLYEISDLRHSEYKYWPREDLEEEFHSTGIKCDGKPANQINSLKYRMNDKKDEKSAPLDGNVPDDIRY